MVQCVLYLAALSAVSMCCAQQCMGQDLNADVLILGAGMAGLQAAETLSKSGIDNFLIIDQLDRIGGRVWSVKFGGGTVELGPQWAFHIDPMDFTAPDDMVRHPLIPLIRRCNITLRSSPLGALGMRHYDRYDNDIAPFVTEALGRFVAALAPDIVSDVMRSLPPGGDLPLSQGLRMGGWNPRTALEEHAEFIAFDFGASISSDLTSYIEEIALHKEQIAAFGPNPLTYVVTNEEGYAAFPQCLAKEYLIEDDPRLMLGTTVEEVMWGDDCICAATTSRGRICARYGIITFSVASLQNGVVQFTPDLPLAKKASLDRLEMGNFLKIFMEFNNTFWDTDADFITYFDDQRARTYAPTLIPWGASFPGKPHILEAIYSGDEAKRIAFQDLSTIQEGLVGILRNIYGDRVSNPVDIIMHDFITSPYFLGDFTSVATGVGVREFNEISVPCGNVHLTGADYELSIRKVVQAAMLNGREVATRIVNAIQGPLSVSFTNGTPRVEGNAVIAQFTASKPVTSMECVINPQEPRRDCSSGEVTFSDLEDGSYQLRVIARIEGEEPERDVASTTLTVSTEDSCAAHLINEGVSVFQARASVEFSSSGLPVSEFQCALDSLDPVPCTSPYILRGLSSGRHRLRIMPVCASKPISRVARFNVML